MLRLGKYFMKKELAEIKNIVRNIEKEQNRENRDDRLKGIDRGLQLIQGRLERMEDRFKALDSHLGIELVRETKYANTHIKTK